MKLRAALALAFGMTLASTVHADTVHDELAAQAAFDRGRALLEAGQTDAACAQFDVSLRLSPALGTLLNLGECYARAGRVASAWIRYKEAVAVAVRQRDAERERIARERVDELGALLCRVIVRPESPEARRAVRVEQAGRPLDENLYDTPIPLDPGEHVFVATAEGRARTELRVMVAEAQPACPDTVVLVALPPRAPSSAGAMPPPARLATPEATRRGMSPRRAAALGVGGAGIASLASGTVLALVAMQQKGRADQQCCTEESLRLDRSSGRLADAATGTFIAGGVLVAASLVLWFTERSHGSTDPASPGRRNGSTDPATPGRRKESTDPARRVPMGLARGFEF